MYNKCRVTALLAVILVSCGLFPAFADEEAIENNVNSEVHDIGSVQVMEQGKSKNLILEPAREVINVQSYKSPGTPKNIVDVLKDMPAIDFRLESDLVPDDDSVYMRGFSSKRFSTAMNGLTIRQSGGRKSSNIVDYGALIPMWMVEDIEVLPGPHSALYPSKSMGGVINIIPRKPVRRTETKPEMNFSTSYSSYETQSQQGDVHGGSGGMIYDVGVQRYSTDGYLRNTETDIMTFYGRGGYVFENDGYLTMSYLYVDADRNLPITNDSSQGNYESKYPEVKSGISAFQEWQNPSSDKIAQSVDVNFVNPTNMGEISIAASYRTENRDRKYLALQGGNVVDASWETKWEQRALKITDSLEIDDENHLVFGAEGSQLLDGYGRTPWVSAYRSHERVRILAGFAEHKWDITPRLNLKVGARYESVQAWVGNTKTNGSEWIAGRGAWIEREWDGFTPKSFLTWQMDDVTESLRDTSVSLGVSRVWRAPDYHGDLNPQGRPAGAWIDPEYGMGYDLVLQRRLWGDIQMKVDFSLYEINDFIAYNRSFAKKPDYEDYRINLKRVEREGVEVMFNGHLHDDLAFYLGYAYNDYTNIGGEPAGDQEVDQRAHHRLNAGITYDLFENTAIIADYKFQDQEETEIINEIAPDVYESHTQKVRAYQLVDLAVEQKMDDLWDTFEDAKVKFYIKNLLDERYDNVNGYPGTDRTFGVSFSVGL